MTSPEPPEPLVPARPGAPRDLGAGGDEASAGSVSLFVDADEVVVVLHGVIGGSLAPDVRDLVADLESNIAATAGRPVRVLAREVTALDLQGVWLLLELRRAARPATVRLVDPSAALRQALELHGLTGFVEEGG